MTKFQQLITILQTVWISQPSHFQACPRNLKQVIVAKPFFQEFEKTYTIKILTRRFWRGMKNSNSLIKNSLQSNEGVRHRFFKQKAKTTRSLIFSTDSIFSTDFTFSPGKLSAKRLWLSSSFDCIMLINNWTELVSWKFQCTKLIPEWFSTTQSKHVPFRPGNTEFDQTWDPYQPDNARDLLLVFYK